MDSSKLAELVYEKGAREEIEKEINSRIEDELEEYEKRIDYLIGANNELFHELERCEKEKKTFAVLADNVTLKNDKEQTHDK